MKFFVSTPVGILMVLGWGVMLGIIIRANHWFGF